ncbi:hypothetical protein ACNKHR_17720 [Shigella flexneri]
MRINPPVIPLSTRRDGQRFCAAIERVPHPAYGNARIPAYEMIRFSVNIMRGCFGSCSSLLSPGTNGTLFKPFRRLNHAIIRSKRSAGHRSRFYGRNSKSWSAKLPTCICCAANRHALNKLVAVCGDFYPDICPHMDTNHEPANQPLSPCA